MEWIGGQEVHLDDRKKRETRKKELFKLRLIYGINGQIARYGETKWNGKEKKIHNGETKSLQSN